MKPTWNDLRLCDIDLHYHAGRERTNGLSLEDYVSYAETSGRRVLGVVDHWPRIAGTHGKKVGDPVAALEHFTKLGTEVAEARKRHPDMIILFGPEVHFDGVLAEAMNGAFDIPEVNFFLAEPDLELYDSWATDRYVDVMKTLASVRERFGVPGFLAHPLRPAVNTLVGMGKNDRAENGVIYPRSTGLRPLRTYDDGRAHVEDVLNMDISVLAEASREYDVPFEINENTWGRMQRQNAQWFMERYIMFYRILLDEGAHVVLGSDLHDATAPTPTAFIPAALLNIDPKQISFLKHWID